jgi:hypothetical protein
LALDSLFQGWADLRSAKVACPPQQPARTRCRIMLRSNSQSEMSKRRLMID